MGVAEHIVVVDVHKEVAVRTPGGDSLVHRRLRVGKLAVHTFAAY